MDTVKAQKINPEVVPPKASCQAIYPALANMFDYPDEGYLEKVDSCVGYLSYKYPEAAKQIQAFGKRLGALTLEARQEAYTRTFDIAPICCPYVSTYIYGEESFERGKLMSRLSEAYQAVGFSTNRELPDHIGVLMRFTKHLHDDELEDLVHYCLRDPVGNMVKRLESTDNLFFPAMHAVKLVLDNDFPENKPQ